MRALSTILAAIMFAAFCIPVCQAESNDYIFAYRFYKMGDYQSAAAYFEKACRNDQENTAEAHYLLGNCYIHLKQNNKAIEHYRQSILLDHRGPHAKHCIKALKQLQEQKKKLAEIRGSTTKTETPKPRTNDTVPQAPIVREEKKPTKEELIIYKVKNLIGRGRDLISLGRPKEGRKLLIEALRAAEKLGSKSESLRNALDALAHYYDRVHNDAKAVRLYERLLRVTGAMYGSTSKEAVQVKHAIAVCFDNSKDYSPARKWYEAYVHGWETLYHKWLNTRKKEYEISKRELVRAYDEIADFHRNYGDEAEYDKYNDLSSQLSRAHRRR